MTTSSTYLESIDSAKNVARYYPLQLVETLFGEWALVRASQMQHFQCHFL